MNEPRLAGIPVIFRCDRNGSHVTAVFPTLPSDARGYEMTCYEHIGQHSGCSHDWYRTTRPASLGEYADLSAELQSIGYVLQVRARITPAMRAECRKKALQRKTKRR
jgi:hypothetical protein